MQKTKLLTPFLALFVFFGYELQGANFYVSSTATGTGDGSLNSPWKLQEALNSPSAITNPNDTVWIWLRAGTYTNAYDAQSSFSCLTIGKSNAPIIFRNYANERVIIDSQLPYTLSCVLSKCSFTWFWGIEFTNSSTADRDHSNTNRNGNIYCTAENIKFINLIIHDMGSGLDLWKTALNTEAYGCIIYNIGNNLLNNTNWEGHGHGMYLQNDTFGTKLIHNNILFNTYGYGMKVWQTTSTAALGNFDIQRNIVFNGGAASENLAGVGNNSRTHNFFLVSNAPGNPITNTVVKHNYTYSGTNTPRPPVNAFGLNYGLKNCIIDSNYLTGQTRLGFNNTPIFETSFKDNKVLPGIPAAYGYYLWGFQITDFPNNTYYYTEPDTGLDYFFVPNKYEANRLHLAIYNWDSVASVSVDLFKAGLKVGDRYELINVMDYFNDKDTGTVASDGMLSVRMTGRTFAPVIGSSQASVSQFPKFGAFVLRKTGEGGSSRLSSIQMSRLNVYPNPSEGKIQIGLQALKVGLYKITVYDSKGAIVMPAVQAVVEEGQESLELDVSEFSDGIYMVSIEGENGNYQGRIVIQQE